MSDETLHWQNKIDHRFRALWDRVPEQERVRYRTRALLRFTGSDEMLSGLGVQIHSVAGDIASCTLALADLPRVAKEAGIIFIELAQPLTHDQ